MSCCGPYQTSNRNNTKLKIKDTNKQSLKALNSFKLVLVGDSNVGKTCILLRLIDKNFTENHCTTIGIDFKSVFCDINFNEMKVTKQESTDINFNIWDTAGQERFKSITNTYYRGADAIILVYDESDKNSVKNLREISKTIHENIESTCPILLLENKVDLKSKTNDYSTRFSNLCKKIFIIIILL